MKLNKEVGINNLSTEMYRNVILNYGFRAIGIIFGLIFTRLSLNYLGKSLYGVWATIASIAAWVNYGDFGIGNGLRNQLSEAVAQGDVELQERLIVTARELLLKIAIVLFGLLSICSEIFFITDIMDINFRIPMYITNFFFCLDLFFGFGRSVAYGYQKSWLTSLAQTGTVTLRIVFILILQLVTSKNLIAFAVANGFGGVIGNCILLIVLFVGYKVNAGYGVQPDKSLQNGIVGLGLKFFVLQLAGLVLYSSDNLIINHFLSSGEVTKYDIITKIYNTGDNLFSILLVSLWSAVTFAMAKKDYLWIKKEIKKLLCFWMVYSLGVIVVSIVFNLIVSIWLGKSAIHYEASLIMLFAVYTILSAFGSIFVNVANGLGRLKMQLIFCCIEAVVNIPLSIFFAKNLGMGLFGVKFATLLCCVGAIAFVPIDIVNHLKSR